MASAKEIRERIHSIQDTMKITNAMYMISSSKMQKAKKVLADTLPFFTEQQAAVAQMMDMMPDYESVFFGKANKPESEIRRGYIVVTADKGLAGAYNHNIEKLALEKIENDDKAMLFVLGELGRHFFTQKGVPMDGTFNYTVQNPTLYRARNIATKMIELYLADTLDEVYIIYTTMKNAFSMEPSMLRLLPLSRGEIESNKDKTQRKMSGVADFHPSIGEVIDNLIPSIVSGHIYGALVESYASEHNSRMMAMQTATDNATDMLHDLNIEYNRVRQAAITQEITEVIAGAKAQKNKHS